MAIYNEILVGRYARMLQKLFGIKGTVPTKQLAGEIMPVFPLKNSTEVMVFEGWQRFGAGLTAGNVAAVNSGFKLRNPGGSNVIAVIERLSFYEATADFFQMGNKNVDNDLSGPIAGFGFDKRGIAQSTCFLSSGSNLGLSQPLGIFPIVANADNEWIVDANQEIPILPGDSMQWVSVNVNVSIRIGLWWRERFLEDSERS